jgi:hypothetical protein
MWRVDLQLYCLKMSGNNNFRTIIWFLNLYIFDFKIQIIREVKRNIKRITNVYKIGCGR